MSTRQTLLIGSLLAIFAGLLVDHGAHFGAEVVQTALLGIALGAVLGIVPGSSATARSIGFVAGFGFAWLGFALRAGVLPDIPAGRAIATSAVVVLITALSAASGSGIPMVASLLGAAAMTGAYEFQFGLNPTAFTTDSVTAATTALLCASLGFLAVEMGLLMTRRSESSTSPPIETIPESAADVEVPTQRQASHDQHTTHRASKGTPA